MSDLAIIKQADTAPAVRQQIFDVACGVKSNRPVNGEYRLLILDAPLHILNCEPGQFFHLLCPVAGSHQPYLRRPMSIYGYYPERGELHFLYKVTGEGTSALATLAPLALEARRLERNLTAICSARSADVLMSIDYFRELGANVITVTDADGSSSVDNLRALIGQQIATSGIDAMYTCGSNRLLKLLQSIGKEHNIPGQIALEQQMACGIGMCQCCVRPFQRDGKIVQERVCREGPVFDLQEAIGW